MCIPIIYILCVKILRMYSVKNSFMLMVICCFHILVASLASILTAWGTEKGCLICFSLNLSGSAGFPDTVSESTSALLRWHVTEQSWLQYYSASGKRGPLRNVSHSCKATVDGHGHEIKTQLHFVIFVHVSIYTVCIFVSVDLTTH